MPVLAQVCIYNLNIVMLSFICKYRHTVGKRTFIFSCTVLITTMAFLMSYSSLIQTSFETFNLWNRIVPLNQGHGILYFICKHNKYMNELRIKTKKVGYTLNMFYSIWLT